MGNKRTPRAVTVTDVPTLLTNLATRRAAMFSNTGSAVALGSDSTVTFATGFPMADGAVWADEHSVDGYYGVCDAGLTSTVWVWETE